MTSVDVVAVALHVGVLVTHKTRHVVLQDHLHGGRSLIDLFVVCAVQELTAPRVVRRIPEVASVLVGHICILRPVFSGKPVDIVRQVVACIEHHVVVAVAVQPRDVLVEV